MNIDINEKTYIAEILRCIYILIKILTMIDVSVSTRMFALE